MESYHKVLMELDELMRSIGKYFIPDLDSLNQFHLTHRQKMILLLFLRNNQITLTEIAQFFEISKSAVSQSLNKLEQENLLIRTINPENRREVNLELGENGKRIQKDLQELEHKMLNNYLKKIPLDDLYQVVKVLRKLEAIVSQENK